MKTLKDIAELLNQSGISHNINLEPRDEIESDDIYYADVLALSWQENRKIKAESDFYKTLIYLKEKNLLTQEYYNRIQPYQHSMPALEILNATIKSLYKKNLLTKKMLDDMLEYDAAFFSKDDSINAPFSMLIRFLSKYKPEFLEGNNYDRLIIKCRQYQQTNNAIIDFIGPFRYLLPARMLDQKMFNLLTDVNFKIETLGKTLGAFYFCASNTSVKMSYLKKILEKYLPILIDQAENGASLARGLVTLAKAALLDHKDHRNLVGLLMDDSKNAEHLATGFVHLNEAKLLNRDDLVARLIKNPVNADRLAQAFVYVSQVNPPSLIRDPQHAMTLAAGLTYLKPTSLNNLPYVKRQLIAHPEHAESLAKGFARLEAANLFDNEALMRQLIAHPEHAESLANGFTYLNEGNLLGDKALIQQLIAHPQQADCLALIFINSNPTERSDLLKGTQITNIITNDSLMDELRHLRNERCLTAENCTALLNNPQYAKSLAHGFTSLKNLNKSPNTAVYHKLLTDHPEYAYFLAETLSILIPSYQNWGSAHEAFLNGQSTLCSALKALVDTKLININASLDREINTDQHQCKQNFVKLLSNVNAIVPLIVAVDTLAKNNLLTQDKLTGLFKHPLRAEEIAKQIMSASAWLKGQKPSIDGINPNDVNKPPLQPIIEVGHDRNSQRRR